ncbi:acyl-CoA dehydrogenase family protein [Streptomyces sp. NPDC005498]|uniref:acyl-CoA dehydrogenase family protein n=1 Tax=Streptomyces sp. NPDC005498 TaxID=3364717 RepID=UPI0036C7B3FA
MRRTVFTEDHEAFRETIRNFVAKEVAPVYPEWEAAGHPPRELFRKLGELGVLGIEVPEEYGGGGQRGFTYQAVVGEETFGPGYMLGGSNVHSNIVMPYFVKYGTQEQKQRWLPRCVTGELMTAIAMTEPGTGSDLAGIRTTAGLSEDGTHYILNGAKTFISGGFMADLVLVVCRTSPATPDNRRGGLSLLVVETDSEGFAVGRVLDKIGFKTSDTAELSFSDVRVPVENLLGEEGAAFSYLGANLVQERLGIAVETCAQADWAIRYTLEYVRNRKVFGQPVAAFQNTKFVLAECAAEVEAARALVDRCLQLRETDELTAADAAKAKLFCTEVAGRVIDKCLQLHGGYGYMREYPIARLYSDIRVTRIVGGTSEVMKSVISKDLGL